MFTRALVGACVHRVGMPAEAESSRSWIPLDVETTARSGTQGQPCKKHVFAATAFALVVGGFVLVLAPFNSTNGYGARIEQAIADGDTRAQAPSPLQGRSPQALPRNHLPPLLLPLRSAYDPGVHGTGWTVPLAHSWPTGHMPLQSKAV